MLHAISANLCRIAASEPKQYSTNHMAHHAKFGSEEDAEFLPSFLKGSKTLLVAAGAAVEPVLLRG